MSVIGLNPKRDKKARLIIYGGMGAYVALLKLLVGLKGAQTVMVNRMNKSLQDKAWEIYSHTGDIKNVVKVFFWDA